jgi:membrane protein implicated in regulation of membrane protease activity
MPGIVAGEIVEDALDPPSLDANRHGHMSLSQIRHVYSVGIGSWALNAMFVAVGGGLATLAVGNIILQVPMALVLAGVALYMLERSYDCLLDSRRKRVAEVTGSARMLQVEASARPLGGLIRGDAWRRRTIVGGRGFWVPSRAEGLLAAGDVTVYFAPRSRVVVNVEPRRLSGTSASVGG